jgi:mersacidin/lichenicidin family type 2 lantibiotic
LPEIVVVVSSNQSTWRRRLMSPEQIIRAWKDVRYRQSLSEEEQALVPAHPAGSIELVASSMEHLFEEASLEVPRTLDVVCSLW